MMNPALLVAGTLAVALGLGHSYHGERLLLIPLFRRGDRPVSPWGGEIFTQQVLRGIWHFCSLMVWTAGALFFIFALGDLEGGAQTAVRIMAGYFGVFALTALIVSRGRHYAWLITSGIAAAAWWSAL